MLFAPSTCFYESIGWTAKFSQSNASTWSEKNNHILEKKYHNWENFYGL